MKETTEKLRHSDSRKHHHIRSFFSVVYGLSDYDFIKKKLHELFGNNDSLDQIEELFDAIQDKDAYTLEHSLGVARIAIRISKELEMEKDEQFLIGIAAFVHDIGKLHIDKRILLKKSKLTTEEWKLIKRHPIYTKIMLSGLIGSNWQEKITAPAAEHHETPDGSGYPKGLKDKEIHAFASIIKVADAFEALTSERPYRKAFSQEESLKMIKDEMGTQFDQRAVKALMEICEREGTIDF